MEKEITTNELAKMVKEGFDATATKLDIQEIKQDIKTINNHLDGIESLVKIAYNHRLEELENKVKTINEHLAIA